MQRWRPTVAVVDLDAIRHNVRLLKPPRAELMAVVKADAYGHGANRVAAAALEAGATWLGVALVEEGIRLRDAGIEAPILVLSEFPPGSELAALAASLTPSLYTEEGLDRLARGAANGRGVRVHVKLDTGMHRVGVAPDAADRFLSAVVAAGLEVEGLWTHFAVSEDPEGAFTRLQLERFLDVVEKAKAQGIRPRYRHAANSGAVMSNPATHLDLVRVGIALYGLAPGPMVPGMDGLRPALSLTSAVAMTKRVAAGEGISYGLRYRPDREATIATIPVGYADGYPRLVSGRAEVLIRGRRRPVAGTVTMDQILVDCRDDPVEPGDPVVLIGEQGDECITADEVAGWMGTIGYDVVCGVGPRVPREFLDGRAKP